VLHALILDDFLDMKLPVFDRNVPSCAAVLQAALLVQCATVSDWSEDNVDFLMRELLGCSR
jgi:hypothetical protein